MFLKITFIREGVKWSYSANAGLTVVRKLLTILDQVFSIFCGQYNYKQWVIIVKV